MIEFEYAAPADLDEAVGLLAKAGERAQLLAGGTDIIVQLREGLRSADLVIDVKKIPELSRLEFLPETGLQLGASVPCWQIYEDAKIAAAYPALAQAVSMIGGWQIQSRASVGGNLCNSSPAADSIPALIALGATAHLAGSNGRRTVSVAEFCTGPGRNVVQKDELLVAITLPPSHAGSGSAYQRFTPRNEMDIAVVGVGSWIQLDESRQCIDAARIALGAVGPTPIFAQQASEFLTGKEANDELFAEAGELAKHVATPISDMRGPAEFRMQLVGVLTRRTLAAAVEHARTFSV
ncbi:MAG TPA: xanthine dehydrogenase family protein subunit M [Pirellulaceae bacterium]|nr:xanthine dehydrogenase family protein subunit M [Pirellulaceae bacterium]